MPEGGTESLAASSAPDAVGALLGRDPQAQDFLHAGNVMSALTPRDRHTPDGHASAMEVCYLIPPARPCTHALGADAHCLIADNPRRRHLATSRYSRSSSKTRAYRRTAGHVERARRPCRRPRLRRDRGETTRFARRRARQVRRRKILHRLRTAADDQGGARVGHATAKPADT